jgi:phenylalanyl-tRNA synthetase beta chain
MLASNAWLKELTGLALDPRDVAVRFTAAGIEVEAMHAHGDGLDRVVVAEVRSIRPHPKREKLQLVTVFDGESEQEVVCGAPNVPAAGGRVALAQLGARLPGGLEIAERELGGVVSRGMLCSERELGIGTGEDGILVLDGSAAQPGSKLAGALGLHDTVYELSLTPNRPDCLGHVGLARELCALYGKPFALPPPRPVAKLATAEAGTWPQASSVFPLPLGNPGPALVNSGFSPVRIEVADGARCPRYGAALVHGVTVGPSPFWLRYRLHVLGLRSISNVVDATNYVLLLWGHPIHGFDYDRLHDSRIAVRLARAGERMRTLDGAEHVLTDDDLLICDGRAPVALAGVMGGADSEIRPSTTRVLIECAYFDPRSVRRTSKRTGLHTDSSHRFERGVDPSAVRAVLASAAALIAGVGGGTAVADALDVVAQPLEERDLRLRLSRAGALLGAPVAPEHARGLLEALGCEVRAGESADELAVRPPTHRPDLGREVDLIEEVARLQGYDVLPTELPRLRASDLGTPAPIVLARQLRVAAAAAGLNEAINYAFVAASDLRAARAAESAMTIVNPLSEERSSMRTSLLPGLAANLRLAQRQQLNRFAQFELARVFTPQPGQLLPLETQQLAVLLWGERAEWFTEGSPLDFYDAKAAVEAIVRPLCGRAPDAVLDDALDHDAPELHPRRRARLRLAEQAIGWVGELHPQVAEALELLGRPIWALLDVPALANALTVVGPPNATPLPRFPAATRDLAVVVPEAVPAGEVAEALRAAAGPLAERVSLFDLYRGEPVPAGHKSLAFHVVYRDPEATLTDKAVDAAHAAVARAAEARFGASLRR